MNLHDEIASSKLTGRKSKDQPESFDIGRTPGGHGFIQNIALHRF